MKSRSFVFSALLMLGSIFAMTFAGSVALAQEGHPFKGTWRGVINMNDEQQALVMIIGYDGENITGMINPGRRSYNFLTASLDAPNWTLSVTARTREDSDISFSAELHEIGARNRFLEGTWNQDGNSYPFKVFRE